MAVVLLSVFGEAIQGSTNIRDQCEWIRYMSESIYLATGAAGLTLYKILLCFLPYHTWSLMRHLTCKETPQNGPGAEPGPRRHKGEFHCSVELTVAQGVTDHFTGQGKSVWERWSKHYLCPFFSAYSHFMALARTLWNPQCHKSWPQKLALISKG